jgi:hypothetical protein
MNERIRELAKKAGDYVNEVYTPPVRSKTPGKIWEDGHVGWHEQFHEKFAELIVKECADIAKHHVMNISTYADAEFVEKQIEEHFGVEE